MLSFLLSLWLTQIVISSVGLSTGFGEYFPQCSYNILTRRNWLAAPLPPGFVGKPLRLVNQTFNSHDHAGCIFTGSSTLFRMCTVKTANGVSLRFLFTAALWVAPLITDSCIFLLTLSRTRTYLKHSKNTPCVPMIASLYIFAHTYHGGIELFIYFSGTVSCIFL